MKVKTLFYNLITSGLKVPEDSLVHKKVRLINFIILLAVPINSIFIYFNFISDQKLFAWFNLITVLLMSSTYFYLRRSKENVGLASHLVLLGVFLVHVPALFQGGIANSGFLWFFLFPLFAIFLTGQKTGLRWILVLLFSIAVMFVFGDCFALPYDPIFLIFLFLALSVETVFVVFSHNVQHRYETLLDRQNSHLKHLSENLQSEVDQQLLMMRKQNEQLEQQSKMASVGEMMSFISHQWKQPISVISTMVQNAQLAELLGDAIPEDSKELYEGILKQTDLMNSTMSDFLKLTNSNLHKERFSVKHSLDMAGALVAQVLTAKKVKLTIHAKEDVFLYGKQNELIHAILNIVNNAIDILIERKIDNAQIVIRLEHDADKIVLSICDNGQGISQKIINKIFDPYFSTKQDNGGTGLGLHMTKKIIEENFEASLEVENSAEGACFTLIFKTEQRDTP